MGKCPLFLKTSKCLSRHQLIKTADRSSWCVAQCWLASKLLKLQAGLFWSCLVEYCWVRVVLDWRPHTLTAYSIWPLQRTQQRSHTVSLPVCLSLKPTSETKKDANSRQPQTDASLSPLFLTITLLFAAPHSPTFNLNWASKQINDKLYLWMTFRALKDNL